MKILFSFLFWLMISLIVFNVWFFLTTYRTLKSEYYKTPKEVIVKEYVSGECECPEYICECDWTNQPAVAE